MNNNFKKFINTAQKIKLSEQKKDLIRGRVVEFVEMNPIKARNPQPLRSPFYPSKFSVLHFSKAVSFALIVLIAGGSTISYASEDTLPGDLFYTVKVNFTEPIQNSLAFSPEAKLEVKTKQVEKRLTEAQILLQKNDTTPAKHAEVEKRIETKIEDISNSIDKLQEKGDIEIILRTTSKLEPVLKAHKEALQEVVTDEEIANNTFVSENTSKESIQTFTTTEKVEITNPTKSEVADNLLKTVERTLEKVEIKEVETLAKADELASKEIGEVTNNKVSEAVKDLDAIKQSIEKEAQELSEESSSNDLEIFLDSSLTSLNDAVKNDLREIMVIEAEILLEESKQLYEQGLYKQALEKAQEAQKLIQGVELNKKITTLQANAEQQVIEIEKIQETVETIKEEKELIQIESQASQAIESLESQLNFE